MAKLLADTVREEIKAASLEMVDAIMHAGQTAIKSRTDCSIITFYYCDGSMLMLQDLRKSAMRSATFAPMGYLLNVQERLV